MSQIEGPAVFPDDCLPPECDYESRYALFKAINEWAALRGYAFATVSEVRGVQHGCGQKRLDFSLLSSI